MSRPTFRTTSCSRRISPRWRTRSSSEHRFSTTTSPSSRWACPIGSSSTARRARSRSDRHSPRTCRPRSSLVGRPGSGFPSRNGSATTSETTAADVLLDPSSTGRGQFNRDAVERLLAEHTNGAVRSRRANLEPADARALAAALRRSDRRVRPEPHCVNRRTALAIVIGAAAHPTPARAGHRAKRSDLRAEREERSLCKHARRRAERMVSCPADRPPTRSRSTASSSPASTGSRGATGSR